MTDVRLYLFGTPRIEVEGQGIKIERRKALAVMAYLALSRKPQSREVLASLLWPNLDDPHAHSALRTTLRTLTVPKTGPLVEADRHTMALKHDAAWVDASAFVALLKRTSAHEHGPDIICEECAALYQQAADLYQGDFMAGYHLPDSLEFDDWQMAQREGLRHELATALRSLAQYASEHKHFEAALAHAQRWLSLDPLNEPAHRLLMRLYAASGQRSEALRQYQQCVKVLDAELATPPEDETTRLYETILGNRFAKSQGSDGRKDAAAGILPPLPPLVVGRGQALNDVKERLGIGQNAMRPVTVIQGWPGVGKSTLVAQLAHDPEVVRQFPDGVLWASLGEAPVLHNEISAWAEVFHLVEPGRARRIDEISAQLSAALRDKRMLLIVDDVWRAEHAAPFRVGGQQCALVMTSRLNDAAAALSPTAHDIYRLAVLAEAPALELLGRLAPDIVREYPQESHALISDLEGLPLAIHVAGRLLQNETRLGWGIGELLAELRSGASLLQAAAPGDMLGAGRDTTPTVAALLKRSTDALDDETRQRFALLGLFVPKPATFDLAAIAAAWDAADPKPAVRTLVNRGLLEPLSGGRFQMHALLVLHARALLEKEGTEPTPPG